MNLLKTSFLSAIAVGTRLATALFLNKILAVYVGPSGYGVIGQLLNFVNLVNMLASGASTTGITKYTAEYQGDDERQKAIWRTAATISVAATGICAIILLAFHSQLAIWLLKRVELGVVFIWFAVALSFFVLNALLLAVLNGKKEIADYAKINIIGSLTGASIAAVLARSWGLEGALVALMVNQSITFFVAIYYCRKKPWFHLSSFWGKFDSVTAIKLGKFSLMTLTSAVAAPLAEMIIRNHIAVKFGWDATGHWQAVVKISDMYLMLVTTTLTLYYLPRFSEIKDATELQRELWRGYKTIIPFVVACSGAIYLLRDLLIELLFTEQFVPMRDLFGWQLMADIVKIAAWILAFLMVSRGMTKLYIISELFFYSLLVVLVYACSRWLGLEGVVFAYFVNYSIYLCFAVYVLKVVLSHLRIAHERVA